MDPTLVAKLNKTCAPNVSATVFLDHNTFFSFDNEFYNQILLKRGILQLDQELALDNSTASTVSGFASNGIRFQNNFAKAMVKLGSIEVLVGKAGEIRNNCRVFNPAN
ncbi:hypothetical protein CMV_013102 [Castanea mollissima]|uniref:peroxidase n=1 Tax=Castanea mollissima TaxID=60419 RepID=A0A8J4VW02_9ROSI|nr:hypothetical protein CMV_013102 [Castanea mollissima]